MTTVHDELNTEVFDKIANASSGDGDGYRALDLIREMESHSASEVQRAVAKLLVEGRIQLTMKRRLKRA